MDIALKTSGIQPGTRVGDVEMTYWPFLIAANRSLDYRVVLCPDFIEEAARKSLFRTKLDCSFDDEPEGRLRFQEIADEKLGKLSLFHKFTFVREGDAVAHDSCGRPIARIAGIVIRGEVDRKRLKSADAERLVDELAPTIDAAFASFWSGGDRGPTSRSGGRVLINGQPAATPPNTNVGRTLPTALPQESRTSVRPGGKRSVSLLLPGPALLRTVIAAASAALIAAVVFWCSAVDARLAEMQRRLIAAEHQLSSVSQELATQQTARPRPQE